MTRMRGLSEKHRDGMRYIWRLSSLGAILSLCAAIAAPATVAAAGSTSTPGSANAQAKDDAVLILAVSRGINTIYDFRPVDLTNGSFTGPPTIRLQANILGFGDEMNGGELPDEGSSSTSSLGRGIQLLMASVPAGDYAVTKVLFGNIDACLDKSAVVVRVPAHKITIVSSGDVAPPEVFSRLSTNTDRSRILQAFDGARTNYPELKGEPANAEIVARISWPWHSGFYLGDRCHDADQFSTIQATTTDTSAARAAALEEAQKNLAKAKSGTTEQGTPSASIGNNQ